MPRDFAQVYQSIWSDPDFRRRDTGEQLLYLKLLSWETLNYAGVLPLQPRKWARATTDTSVRDVEETLQRLDEARYVLVDWDTEEALLRTFIRGDRLYKNPPMLRAALQFAQQVESPRLRVALAEEMAAVHALMPDGLVKIGREQTDLKADVLAVSHSLTTPPSHPAPSPPPDGAENPPPVPSDTPAPQGVLDGVAGEAGTGTGTGKGVRVDTSGGNAAEVDAGASNAPLEDHNDDQPPAAPVDPEADERAYEEFVAEARQRITGTGPAVHENAMPPARCPVHRDHPADWVEERCGRCKTARQAQETWIADRDAKIAAGKAAVAAEQREARRLERQQIDDCDRCDDRGILPTAVRCTHDQRSDPDQLPPGRAAFLAEKAKLVARAAAKAKTTDAPPATGEQLKLIAIRFGEHGVNDRDKRLTVLGEIVGRTLASSRELTRTEATVVLDRFDHPPAEEPPPDDGGQVVLGTVGELPDGPDLGEPIEPPSVLPGDPDYVDAEIVEAEIVLAEDEDDVPPADPMDDATGGFEDEYRADQQTWADAEPDPSSYVYAGGPNDPPF